MTVLAQHDEQSTSPERQIESMEELKAILDENQESLREGLLNIAYFSLRDHTIGSGHELDFRVLSGNLCGACDHKSLIINSTSKMDEDPRKYGRAKIVWFVDGIPPSNIIPSVKDSRTVEFYFSINESDARAAQELGEWVGPREVFTLEEIKINDPVDGVKKAEPLNIERIAQTLNKIMEPLNKFEEAKHNLDTFAEEGIITKEDANILYEAIKEFGNFHYREPAIDAEKRNPYFMQDCLLIPGEFEQFCKARYNYKGRSNSAHYGTRTPHNEPGFSEYSFYHGVTFYGTSRQDGVVIDWTTWQYSNLLRKVPFPYIYRVQDQKGPNGFGHLYFWDEIDVDPLERSAYNPPTS